MVTPPPLVLVGHGSQDEAGAAAFRDFTARMAARLAPEGIDVAGGFIELSDPPLRDAVAELVARGHRHLVAVPAVLSAASHAKGDIPASLARERARHPGLTWSYGRALGPHPVLLGLLAGRIAAAVPLLPQWATKEDPRVTPAIADGRPTVLIAARGTSDPDANAEVYKTARLLWEGRDYASAETAFVSLAEPGIPAGLERCRLLGARQVIVARYFLFPGVLPDRVDDQAREYAAAHPGLGVLGTDVLGDCDELAGLVTERYHEALGGDIRMNCDTCVYRIAMPGSAHLVGAAQRPHAHPGEDGYVSDHGHAGENGHPAEHGHPHAHGAGGQQAGHRHVH
jgi:sirohydrochlorin cobaltochelatase